MSFGSHHRSTMKSSFPENNIQISEKKQHVQQQKTTSLQQDFQGSKHTPQNVLQQVCNKIRSTPQKPQHHNSRIISARFGFRPCSSLCSLTQSKRHKVRMCYVVQHMSALQHSKCSGPRVLGRTGLVGQGSWAGPAWFWLGGPRVLGWAGLVLNT